MKKTVGICRNKYESLQIAKSTLDRKKNMYPIIYKDSNMSEKTIHSLKVLQLTFRIKQRTQQFMSI